jgi:hypothetical protein
MRESTAKPLGIPSIEAGLTDPTVSCKPNKLVICNLLCKIGVYEEEQINASYTDGQQSQDRTK